MCTDVRGAVPRRGGVGAGGGAQLRHRAHVPGRGPRRAAQVP